MTNILIPEAPHIWTRRPKIIETRDPVRMATGLAGFIRMRAYRPDGRCRVDTGWFHNLITDTGLNIPPVTGNVADSCCVGTGNTPPTVTDVGLVAQVAETHTHQASEEASNQTADRYTYVRMTFRFGAGDAAGNLAEVGFKSSNDLLWSRALILDGDGNPTTLTILPDEVLDVTYEVRVYPNLVDTVTQMTVSGVDYDITIRAMEVGSWGIRAPGSWISFLTGVRAGFVSATNGVIGSVTGSPSGSSSNASSQLNAEYVNNTHYHEFTTTWDLNRANFSPGVTAFRLPMGAMSLGGTPTGGTKYQVGLNGGQFLPKNSTNNLTLTWRHTWARRSI